MRACVPSDEAERLAALDDYDILDTEREADFDEACKLAAAICETPIAVVNFIAQGRQWFKAEEGLGVRELPLDDSICAHAILEEEMLVVPDTTVDPRFADNGLVVGEPHLRFYAGVLLKTDEGHAIGTVCVLDYQTRTLDERQLQALRVLGTHVMRMLELRRTNRRLEAQIERRSQLLRAVAHDVRTPLHVIRTGTDLLQRSAEPATTAVLAPSLSRAASSLLRLVDDLLVQERFDDALVEPTPCSADEVLQTVLQMLQPLADAQGVQLSSLHEGDAQVVADPGRVHQLLTNLVSNAVRHSPRGARVRVHSVASADAWRLAVIDQGPGIAPEDRERVFQPFQRATSADGHGLGLAIVRQLAEAHGGTVRLHCPEEGGCRFDVELPRADRQ
jgi:signal transduction histidine kinase